MHSYKCVADLLMTISFKTYISTEVYFDYIYVIPYNAASPNIDYNNWVCCESHWTFRACTDIETK